MTLAQTQLSDPGAFVAGVPHDLFARLRREAPISWHDEPDGSGFWALTRYDDVVTMSTDPGTYSSARKATTLFDPPPDALAMMQTLMLNMDPPRHTQYRRLVSKGFTPQMVRQLEPHVRDIANGIIDGVAARSECDFVTEVAAELPLQAIAEMMGVPYGDRHKVFDWSNRLIGSDDPEYATSPDEARQAGMEMYLYANGLALERKREPRDDIISVLLRADVDGEALSEPDFDAFFLLLAVAGNETTRNLISGGMLALIEHPEQRARLLADPSLITTAVEEMLRWVSPVMYFRRTLTRDAVLRGQALREGDKIVMYYISANRDEDVFERSDTFDVARDPNAHLAFGGGGPHFCLGASLARLEIRVMFEELLRRLPDIELAGPPQRLRSNFINGIKHMPVRFTPER